MAEDALVASRLQAYSGGGQPAMRDTVWNGRPQRLVDSKGVPIGARAICKMRGIDIKGKKLDDLKAILAQHPDLANEKSQLKHLLNSRGHVCYFIPKFHCELNPIERCWAQSKKYTRAYCNYTIQGLRKKHSSSPRLHIC